MTEQQLAGAIAILTMMASVIAAVWLCDRGRRGRLTADAVQPVESNVAEAANEQARVPVVRAGQQDSAKKERAKKPPKAHSAANCPLCRAEGHGQKPGCAHREMLEYDGQAQRKLIPYWQVKSEQGRPKRSNTEGHCCQNAGCYYREVSDSTMHALVFDGKRELANGEEVQLLKCQHCNTKFCARCNTVMYGLKTPTQEVRRSLAALAEGLSVNATARVFEHGWQTIQRWSDRGATHMSKLHELMFRGLEAVSVELDELRTRIKGQADAVWVWVAFEAKSKLRLATHIGARTQDNAHILIHKMKQTLAEHCVPVFSSDGLKLYFGALTGHYGWWHESHDDNNPANDATLRKRKKKTVWQWIVDPDLLYGQMIKRYARRKLHEVKRKIMIGDLGEYVRRLRAHGFSGLINTAKIERHNLQMRQSVSPLIRRTWSLVCSIVALERRLELQRGFYHFSKPHGGLRLKLDEPRARGGQRIPQLYQQQTPAMAAGLSDHIWSLDEILLFPLPPASHILALPPAQIPEIRRK